MLGSGGSCFAPKCALVGGEMEMFDDPVHAS
jgi:hypothetical protein